MSDHLRVLFVPHAYAPVKGGTELLCQRVAETFAQAGHDVRVLTTDAGSVESYYQFGVPPVRNAATETNGVEIIRLPLGGFAYGSLGTAASLLPRGHIRERFETRARQAIWWMLVRGVRRELVRYQPDVVVTLPHLVVNVQAVLTANRLRPFPLVMLPLLHEESPQWDLIAMRSALVQADAVVAITASERDRLIDAYGVAPPDVFVGGMGVDMPASAPGAPSHGPVVFLGRQVPQKGIPLLIDAMERVWRVRPETKLVLAGARSLQSDVIDAKVKALPSDLRKNVSSEYDVGEVRKTEILSTAACLVLPSRVESFGGVILEAWARAVPAIAFDLPVFREIIDRDVNGLLVHPDDAAALAKAVIWAVEHPQQARGMGLAGFEKAASHFTWETVAARHLDACRHALQKFRVRAHA